MSLQSSPLFFISDWALSLRSHVGAGTEPFLCVNTDTRVTGTPRLPPPGVLPSGPLHPSGVSETGALRQWPLGTNIGCVKTLRGAGILRQSLCWPLREVGLGKAGEWWREVCRRMGIGIWASSEKGTKNIWVGLCYMEVGNPVPLKRGAAKPHTSASLWKT